MLTPAKVRHSSALNARPAIRHARWIHASGSTFQRKIVPSRLLEMSVFPSGLKARLLTIS
jgi:hypothetical protein